MPETLKEKTVQMIMTMSIANLTDADFVCRKLFMGRAGSERDDEVHRALEIRKLLEDMKVTRASHRVACLAIIIAAFSLVVSWIR
ncbi:MAG: hypothetical protein IID36_11435 [Planctomycetes bacterium]|nr:hypothetical protein [Planctomycetota bacterium]